MKLAAEEVVSHDEVLEIGRNKAQLMLSLVEAVIQDITTQ